MKTKKALLLILSIICLWNVTTYAQGTTCASARAVKTEDGTVDYSFQPKINAAWFSFVATGPVANVEISRVVSAIDTPFASLDSLVIYSGSCGALTALSSSVKRGSGPYDSLPAVQALGLTAGQTYFIKVTCKLKPGSSNTSHFALRPIHIITGPIIPKCSLPMCGPNLLCNGDFESQPSWSSGSNYQDNSYSYPSIPAVAPENSYCIASPNMRYAGNNFVGLVRACADTENDFTDMYSIGTWMFSNTAESGSWFMAVDPPSDACADCSSTAVTYYCTGDTLNTPNYTCIPWQQSVTVIPGRTYTFSNWIKSIDGTAYNGATVSMNINGAFPFFQDVISPSIHSAYMNWTEICYNWTAPAGVTTATIQVIGQGGSSLQGYDFGLDNFSFGLSSPPVIALNSPTVCAGTSATLTATPAVAGASYTWSTGATTTSNVLVVSPSGTTTYSVQVSVGKCTSTATSTVTVTSAPIICIADSQQACIGDCVTISTACRNTPQPTTYVWSPATGLSATTGGTVTACPTANTTYSVIATNTITGCTAHATSVVTFYTSSPAVTTLSSLVCGRACTGTASAVASGGLAPYTYSWAPGGATTAGVSGLCAGTYTVTVTDAHGCSKTATASVLELTPPTITATSTTVCAGTSATICASGGTFYSWSNGANTACITVTPIGTTTYTVTGSNRLCTATATGTVTVNPAPIICIADTQQECTVGCVTINTACRNTPQPTTYVWSPATGLSATTGGSVTACPKVNTTYTVVATNTVTGCTATATSAIEIFPATFTISGASMVLCGNPYAYSISPVMGGYTYQWNFYNGLSHTSGYGSSVTITPTTTGSIQWIVTGPTGCQSTTTLAIKCGMIRGEENTNTLANTDVVVYPNPAGEAVNVKLELEPHQQLNICMYNNLGEVIKCETITENVSTISTSMLASGIYFYRITNTDGSLIKSDKIMIVH